MGPKSERFDEEWMESRAQNAVRAVGSQRGTGSRIYVDLEDREITGHEKAAMEIEAAIERGPTVYMKHIGPSSGAASIGSKFDFFRHGLKPVR